MPRKVHREKKISTVAVPHRRKSLPDAVPISIDSERFQWSAHEIDHDYSGDWDWNLNPKEARDILDLLARMSKLDWREVKALSTHSKGGSRPLHHSQSVTSICADAQRRLSDLQIVVDEVFRLRHGNLPRLWGYLSGAVFNIVWWDRNHRIYPTEP